MLKALFCLFHGKKEEVRRYGLLTSMCRFSYYCYKLYFTSS